MAEVIRFILPRKYNGADLYNGYPFVHTQNAKGNRVTSSLVKFKKTRYTILLDWRISSDHTTEAGTIDIQVSVQGEAGTLFSSDTVTAQIDEAIYNDAETAVTVAALKAQSESLEIAPEPLAAAVAPLMQTMGLMTPFAVVDEKEKPPVTVSGRSMSIPEDSKKIGVRGDRNAETVTFTLDRYYDGQNFAAKNFFVEILNAENSYDIAAANAVDYDDEKLTLEWLVGPRNAAAAGIAKVRIRATEGENFIWQSYIGEFNIADTFDQNIPEVEPGITVVDQTLIILEELQAKTIQASESANAAKNTAVDAKTAASTAANSAVGAKEAAAASAATAAKAKDDTIAAASAVVGVVAEAKEVTAEMVDKLAILDSYSAADIPTAALVATVETVAKQTVTTQGKNLLDLKRVYGNMPTVYTVNGNSVTVIAVDGRLWSAILDVDTAFLVAGTYTLSGSFPAGARLQVGSVTRPSFATTSSFPYTFTIPTDDRIIIKILQASGTPTPTYPFVVENMQIELGSTATAFEPFTPNSPSPDYPAAITGVASVTVNQFGADAVPFETQAATQAGVTFAPLGDGKYHISGTTTASSATYMLTRSYPNDPVTLGYIRPGVTYTWGGGVPFRDGVEQIYFSVGRYKKETGTYVGGVDLHIGDGTQKTFTLESMNIPTDEFVSFYMQVRTVGRTVDAVVRPFISETAKLHTLTPQAPLYGLDGARDEINNIGSASKRTRRRTLTSADAFDLSTTIPTTGGRAFYLNLADGPRAPTQTALKVALARFKPMNTVSVAALQVGTAIHRAGASASELFVCTQHQTLAEFKAWFNSIGGFDVLYQLATPATEVITKAPIRAFPGENTMISPQGEVSFKGKSVQEILDEFSAAIVGG